MVQEYEDNIIPPPMEFKDNYKPIPAPRTKKILPVATSRTKINQTRKALKGFIKSFEISLKTDKDPLVLLQNTRKPIERLFGTILRDTKGFKFVETLKVTFIMRKMIKTSTNQLISIAEHKSLSTSINSMKICKTSKQQTLNGVAV